MRHRALLFGILGGFIIYSAFRSQLRTPALTLGLISMLGFVFIAWQTGGYNELVQRVIFIDIAALFGLLLAAILHLKIRSTP